jgi:CheY-like chemotaxis protein
MQFSTGVAPVPNPYQRTILLAFATCDSNRAAVSRPYLAPDAAGNISGELQLGTATMVSAEPTPKAPRQSASGTQNGADRRRRRRARISAQVHVKTVSAQQPFEEVCTTIDVCRDGLLFTSQSAPYRKGERVDIIFPYSSMVGAIHQGQPAEIVRVVRQESGRCSVAVQFVSAKADEKSERRGAGSHAAKKQGPGRESVVLAVQADPRGAESMRNLLEQDGYTVITVPTAQDALEILRTIVPSAFIAEVEAEDMSGQDLCVIIKQNERLQGVPVILITRSAHPADYARSHQLGAVVCMAKPFKPERLQQVVRLVAPPPALSDAHGSR